MTLDLHFTPLVPKFAVGIDNDTRLPRNPEILFLKGYAREGAQRQKEAAPYYIDYLKVVQQGSQAQHAYQRLVQWGYLRP